MKKQIKVTNTQAVSVVEENGVYEVAHLVNGHYSESILDDVRRFDDEVELFDFLSDLVAEILQKELEEDWGATKPSENLVIVDNGEYTVWVSVSVNRFEVFYDLNTVREGDEGSDRNLQTRKTFKGLVNYLKKFDR